MIRTNKHNRRLLDASALASATGSAGRKVTVACLFIFIDLLTTSGQLVFAGTPRQLVETRVVSTETTRRETHSRSADRCVAAPVRTFLTQVLLFVIVDLVLVFGFWFLVFGHRVVSSTRLDTVWRFEARARRNTWRPNESESRRRTSSNLAERQENAALWIPVE